LILIAYLYEVRYGTVPLPTPKKVEEEVKYVRADGISTKEIRNFFKEISTLHTTEIPASLEV
jgi:hypothetical protein